MLRALSLCLVASVFACDCGETPKPPTTTPDCVLDGDCALGATCQNGTCVTPLEGEGEEGEGEEGEGEGEAPVLGVLSVLPEDDVEFGAVRLGSVVERNITLKNTGPVALTLIQIVIDDNEAATFSAEPTGALNQTLAPGDELGVLLRHVPNDGVPDSAELKVLHTGEGQLTSVVLHAEFKGISTLSVTSSPTVLSPDETELNFGDVAVGESRALTVFVRNDGDADSVLTLANATLTPANQAFALSTPALPQALSFFDGLCVADVVECPPGTAACTGGVCVDAAGTPVDSLPVTVTFAPTTAEAREGTLTLRSDVGGVADTAVDVVVRGRGVAGALGIAPSPLTFDEVFVGSPQRRTVTVTNIGGAATTLNGASLFFGAGTFDLEQTFTFPVTLAPNDAITVDVVFTPPTSGQFNNVIVWDVVGAASDPQTAIIGNARLAPEFGLYTGGLPNGTAVDLDAADVNFGDLFVGRSTNRTFRIVNDGPAGSTLAVRRMVLEGPQADRFTFAPTTIDDQLPGNVNLEPHVDLTLTYLPSSLTGFEDEATLVLETDDPARPTVELQLRGRAVQPIIGVNPTAVDFGPVLVGTNPSPQKTVVVSYAGGFGPLTIDSIDPPGLAVYTMTTSVPLPVTFTSPTDSLTITLTYTPLNPNNFVASTSITVRSSDVDRGPVVVSVVGSSGGCPPRANASVVVNGSTCEYTCNNNFHECGDACLANNSPDSCGESCTPCATRTNADRGCTVATSTCTYSCQSNTRDLNGNLSVGQGQGSDGCEYQCPVRPPVGETCNTLDDDCDGARDEGLSLDPFDSPAPGNRNDSCNAAIRIGDAIEGGQVQIATPTLYDGDLTSADEDWFIVKAKEQSNACFPGSGEDFQTTFTLSGIPAGSDYDLEVRDQDCNGATFTSANGGNANDEVVLNFGGTCALGDDRDFRVRVHRFSGGSCAPYTLTVKHRQR